ncbi:MAG: DHHA1 domain-containing protein [Candidatus Asgardarchaeia archaeon]
MIVKNLMKEWLYFRKLNGSKVKNIIVTHGDLDGICSAAIVMRKLQDAFVMFSGAGRCYEKIKFLRGFGKNLYILDMGLNYSYAYKTYSTLRELKEKNWKIVWIDHHVWDKQWMEKIGEVVDRLIVDRERVTGEIVLELFGGDDFSTELAKIARDSDTLNRNNEYVRMYEYAINYKGYKAGHYLLKLFKESILVDDLITRWAEEGEKIDLLSIEAGKKGKVFKTKSGSRYALLDLREKKLNGIASAHAASKTLGVDFVVVLYKNDRISLYRGENQDVDILKIAKMFGGGGHPFSCGIKLRLGALDKLLSSIFRRHYLPRGIREVLEAINENL